MKQNQKTTSLNRKTGIWFCLLLAATLAVYWQVIEFDFVNFDDDVNIYENKNIQTGLTMESLRWAFTAVYWSTWQPMVWISYMFDFLLYGLNPGGYHFTNLILHCMNSFLLLSVFYRMTGAFYPCAFIAFLFGLHPMHVESVAWATERKDVLSTFFWMLSLWSYVRYTETHGRVTYSLVALFMLLGVMTKQMIVTLPFTFLLLDIWPLRRTNPPGSMHGLFPLIAEKIPLFSLSALACIIAIHVSSVGGAVKSLSYFPIHVRLSNALVSYSNYLIKLFWPFDLAAYYPHTGTIDTASTVGSALLFLSLTLIAFRVIRNHPWFSVGWFWYIGTLVPMIGIVQIGSHAMADRFVYIPAIGIYLILAWGGITLLRKMVPQPKWIVFFATCFFLTLGLIAWNQTTYWRNTETLFLHAIDVTTNNYIAHNNLGLSLRDQGKNAQAIQQFAKSVSIKSDYVISLNNLGVTLESIGKPDQAVIYYRRAIQSNPTYHDPYVNLAFILFHQDELEQAISLCQTAIRINSESFKAYLIMGDCMDKQGYQQKAVAFYQRALSINPQSADAHTRLGAVYLKTNKLEKTIQHFRLASKITPSDRNYQANLDKAISLNKTIHDQIRKTVSEIKHHPADLYLYNKLGRLYRRIGQDELALAQFKKALALDPDSIPTLLNITVLLIDQNEPKESEHYLEKIIMQNPGDPVFQYNIACIYAKQNQVDKSLFWLKKALDAGYANQKLLHSDKNLDNIRNTSAFKSLIDGTVNPD